MSEFQTTAQLSLGVEDGAISSVRQQIESGLEDIGIGLTGGDVTFALEGRSQDILDGILNVSTSIAERTGRTADALESEDGGGRERRRRRQEFRWSRENTSNLEDAVTFLESIDDTLDDQSGGGDGFLGALLGGGGRAAGGAGGTAVATGALGIGAGAGLAGLGIGAGVGAARGQFAEEEFVIDVGGVSIENLEPSFEGPFVELPDVTISPQIGPERFDFNPQFGPENFEISPEIGEEAFSIQEDAITIGEEALSIQEGAVTVGEEALSVQEGAITVGEDALSIQEGAVDLSPEFNLNVEASLGDLSIDFSPQIDFSPSIRLDVDTDLTNFADEATDRVLNELNPAEQSLVDSLQSEVNNLERTIERELG